MDVLAKALADLNAVARSEFKLKPEQEVAVKSLLDGKRCISGVYHRIRQKAHLSNVCSRHGLRNEWKRNDSGDFSVG